MSVDWTGLFSSSGSRGTVMFRVFEYERNRYKLKASEHGAVSVRSLTAPLEPRLIEVELDREGWRSSSRVSWVVPRRADGVVVDAWCVADFPSEVIVAWYMLFPDMELSAGEECVFEPGMVSVLFDDA